MSAKIPVDAQEAFDRGKKFYDSEDDNNAIKEFNEAIRLYPDFAAAYAYRGNIWRLKEDFDQAINDSNEAIKLDPSIALAYRCRGASFDNKRQFDEALIDYNEAIKLDPTVDWVFKSRADVYYHKGLNDEAIKNYTEVIKIKPDVFAYVNRAQAYRNQEKYNEALNDLAEAIKLDPKEACVYAVRSEIYLKKNAGAMAEFDATEAIKLDPTITLAYKTRGDLFAKVGKFEQAIKDFNEAMKYEPASAWPYCYRGDVYRAMGKRAEAKADYLKALSIDNDYQYVKNKLEEMGMAGSGRQSKKVGSLRKKCPSCGESIESFQTRCPACDHELGAAETNSNFQYFVDEFERVGNRQHIIENPFKIACEEADTFVNFYIGELLISDGDSVRPGERIATIVSKNPARKTKPRTKDVFAEGGGEGYKGQVTVNLYVREGDKLDPVLYGALYNVPHPAAFAHQALCHVPLQGKTEDHDYQWNEDDETQRFFVLTSELDTTKENLLEMLVYCSGKINLSARTLWEKTWDSVWRRKCKQIYAMARLCLKSDKKTLEQMEKIIAEKGLSNG